jgi:hypothetical protein
MCVDECLIDLIPLLLAWGILLYIEEFKPLAINVSFLNWLTNWPTRGRLVVDSTPHII